MDYQQGIVIRFNRPDSDDGRRLSARLDADLLQRYPAIAMHGLHPPDVAQICWLRRDPVLRGVCGRSVQRLFREAINLRGHLRKRCRATHYPKDY
jgi:hypothetical protein